MSTPVVLHTPRELNGGLFMDPISIRIDDSPTYRIRFSASPLPGDPTRSRFILSATASDQYGSDAFYRPAALAPPAPIVHSWSRQNTPLSTKELTLPLSSLIDPSFPEPLERALRTEWSEVLHGLVITSLVYHRCLCLSSDLSDPEIDFTTFIARASEYISEIRNSVFWRDGAPPMREWLDGRRFGPGLDGRESFLDREAAARNEFAAALQSTAVQRGLRRMTDGQLLAQIQASQRRLEEYRSGRRGRHRGNRG